MTLHEWLVAARNRLDGRWQTGVGHWTNSVDNTCAIGSLASVLYNHDTATVRLRNCTTSDALRYINTLGPLNAELEALLNKHNLSLHTRNIYQWIAEFNDSSCEQAVLDLFDTLIAETAPLPEEVELECVEVQEEEAIPA